MAELPIDLGALIKLTQRSQDLLYDDKETDAFAGPHQQLRVAAAELAIVAAARSVAQVGAIGLLPDVRRWAELSPTGEDPVSIPHALIDALAICVRDGLDIDQLEPMLDGFEDWMIAKIADALDPERERSLALLQRLADDPRARVSGAASKRLGARRQWCWWAGIFDHRSDRDPRGRPCDRRAAKACSRCPRSRERRRRACSSAAVERVDLSPELGRLLPLAEQDKSLVHALRCAVKRLDPESRAAFVQRGMTSQSDKVRALALEQLATLPPDSKHGSITRFWSEPALRDAITSNRRLCEAFVPFLRRQLRAQALDLSEATATLAAVARLWEGAVGPHVHVDIDRAARLEELAPWHDGASELGPPTEDEWAIWRALRQQKLEAGQVTPIHVLALRPPGPLQAVDRAVVDELMRRWRERWREPDRPDWQKFELLHFHQALLPFGGAELLDQLEELLAAAREIDDAMLVEQMEPALEQLRQAPKE